MEEKQRSRRAAQAAILAVGLVLLSLAYFFSIGPVYYCWAALSADMAAHSEIEWFYSPLLECNLPWIRGLARDYRDVSRIAGHHLTNP
jgi:hypothetical protein